MCICVSQCHVCAGAFIGASMWVLDLLELKLQVIRGYHGCWKLNSSPPEEQPNTLKLSLQPQAVVFTLLLFPTSSFIIFWLHVTDV